MPNIPASSQKTFCWFSRLSTAVKQPGCHFLTSVCPPGANVQVHGSESWRLERGGVSKAEREPQPLLPYRPKVRDEEGLGKQTSGTSSETGREDPQIKISLDVKMIYHLLGGQIAAGGAPLAAAATCFHLHRSYVKNVQAQEGWWWGLMTHCHTL